LDSEALRACLGKRNLPFEENLAIEEDLVRRVKEYVSNFDIKRELCYFLIFAQSFINWKKEIRFEDVCPSELL
jgi:hypothetical protein